MGIGAEPGEASERSTTQSHVVGALVDGREPSWRRAPMLRALRTARRGLQEATDWRCEYVDRNRSVQLSLARALRST